VQKVPYEESSSATANRLAKRKGLIPMDTVALMLCALPFIVLAAGIAILLGQPSLSVTLILWGNMVVLIVGFFGAFAWKLRDR
jgi:hypothetical protein